MLVTEFNYDDLIIGDKNAIMVAARILSYGKDYEFDLNGFEAIQYTVYNEEGEQRYDLHMDTILGTDKSMDLPETRKLSLSMVLSDPSEYEGGKFQLQTGSPEEDKLMTVEQLKGRVIGFPSFLLHRVSPVTKGTRKSLVVWVEGPKFK